MPVVRFKFSSTSQIETVPVHEPSGGISVKDLKAAICELKNLGKSPDATLRLVNSDTMEAYDDEDYVIPQNRLVIVQRVPTGVTVKKNRGNDEHADKGSTAGPSSSFRPIGPLTQRLGNLSADENTPADESVDLSAIFNEGQGILEDGVPAEFQGMTEEERIKAVMNQGAADYNPAEYKKIKGRPTGKVPDNYMCFKCGAHGHWIQDCPRELRKKCTGIPLSFMKRVDDPNAPGAMLMADGGYAVPTVASEAYMQPKKDPVPFLDQLIAARNTKEEKMNEDVERLLCGVCLELPQDAMKLACCASLFCDDCVRPILEETRECPSCHAIDVQPKEIKPALEERCKVRLARMNLLGKMNHLDIAEGSMDMTDKNWQPEVVYIPSSPESDSQKGAVWPVNNLAVAQNSIHLSDTEPSDDDNDSGNPRGEGGMADQHMTQKPLSHSDLLDKASAGLSQEPTAGISGVHNTSMADHDGNAGIADTPPVDGHTSGEIPDKSDTAAGNCSTHRAGFPPESHIDSTKNVMCDDEHPLGLPNDPELVNEEGENPAKEDPEPGELDDDDSDDEEAVAAAKAKAKAAMAKTLNDDHAHPTSRPIPALGENVQLPRVSASAFMPEEGFSSSRNNLPVAAAVPAHPLPGLLANLLDSSNLPPSQLGLMGPAPGILPGFPGLRLPGLGGLPAPAVNPLAVPNPYNLPYLIPGHPLYNPVAAAAAAAAYRQVTTMPWTASMYLNPQAAAALRHPFMPAGMMGFPPRFPHGMMQPVLRPSSDPASYGQVHGPVYRSPAAGPDGQPGAQRSPPQQQQEQDSHGGRRHAEDPQQRSRNDDHRGREDTRGGGGGFGGDMFVKERGGRDARPARHDNFDPYHHGQNERGRSAGRNSRDRNNRDRDFNRRRRQGHHSRSRSRSRNRRTFSRRLDDNNVGRNSNGGRYDRVKTSTFKPADRSCAGSSSEHGDCRDPAVAGPSGVGLTVSGEYRGSSSSREHNGMAREKGNKMDHLGSKPSLNTKSEDRAGPSGRVAQSMQSQAGPPGSSGNSSYKRPSGSDGQKAGMANMKSTVKSGKKPERARRSSSSSDSDDSSTSYSSSSGSSSGSSGSSSSGSSSSSTGSSSSSSDSEDDRRITQKNRRLRNQQPRGAVTKTIPQGGQEKPEQNGWVHQQGQRPGPKYASGMGLPRTVNQSELKYETRLGAQNQGGKVPSIKLMVTTGADNHVNAENHTDEVSKEGEDEVLKNMSDDHEDNNGLKRPIENIPTNGVEADFMPEGNADGSMEPPMKKIKEEPIDDIGEAENYGFGIEF